MPASSTQSPALFTFRGARESLSGSVRPETAL